jgi:ribosomal protein L12E/L44/L45/RPP1/RPP2
VNAAGIKMEPYWASLFAKLFANKSIGDLISNVGAGEPALVARSECALCALPQQRCSILV